MKDLTTKEGKTAEIIKLENSFLTALRSNGFNICPDVVCRICTNSIVLGIAAYGFGKDKGLKMAFASDITLYGYNPNSMFGRQINEITFGSSGPFTPDVKECYWRTIHAASILNNWETACSIVNTHCKMYADLEKECFESNHII